MSVWLRNRRTGNVFQTIRNRRSLRVGRYFDEVRWLGDHGFRYASQYITPDDYIWETWIDNYGNVVQFKVDRPSGEGMENATIVDSRYIPTRER